ncbi:PIN-like domain-containing protein [Pseudomonas sp. GL-B-19]|uniref:PIN-like domain-containing protein n=1 Tax=Pseudomonas sp. GL-B-19 TaxID=2832393 RepID=UPI001CBD8316|nr:PIN-like domain-containing protein [Pseudomonas sp. GL-B-19]
MKKMFPGYFASDAENLKVIWEQCLFVLDANVLLSLYRYSDYTRSELVEIFHLLGDRVWVPNQVAGEYLINRIGVINQQVKVYDDAIKNVEELKRSFENPRQHPFVKEATFRELGASFDKVVSELNENKKTYLGKIESDDVKAELEKLLDGRVGSPLTTEEIKDVLSTGQDRYSQKIPPGYKDAKKGGDSDVIAERLKPYGDYIVWRQTLDKAKAEGVPVVFVTGDKKEDWWTIFSGNPIEPHPQLVEEFVREVGHGFFMYLPEKFMERANEYLNRATSQRAVDEIVDVRSEDLVEDLASSASSDSSDGFGRFGGFGNFGNFDRSGSLQDFHDFLNNSSAANMTVSQKVRLQQLYLERESFERRLVTIQPRMSSLEFKIEATEHEQLDLVARQKVSLEGSNGVESAHSKKLGDRIKACIFESAKLQQELLRMKEEYNKVLQQLLELKWEVAAVFGEDSLQ